jgi:putative hydrolase of the HAD superfamily
VIFDLFGTLVPAFSSEEAADGYGAVADDLGVSREAFMLRWMEWAEPRGTGELSVEECFLRTCRALGVDGDLEGFLELRHGFLRQQIAPLPGAVDALGAAGRHGGRVGLLSNCSSDVPAVFAETPLAPLVDDAVFSCSVGLAKPDERIFHLAAGRLGVPPDRCLFVDDREENLAAARSVGMDVAPAEDLSRLPL